MKIKLSYFLSYSVMEKLLCTILFDFLSQALFIQKIIGNFGNVFEFAFCEKPTVVDKVIKQIFLEW